MLIFARKFNGMSEARRIFFLNFLFKFLEKINPLFKCKLTVSNFLLFLSFTLFNTLQFI